MKFLIVLLTLFLKLLHVENRMLSRSFMDVPADAAPYETEPTDEHNDDQPTNENEKVIGLKKSEESEQEREDADEIDKKYSEDLKKPCAIVVLSNVQNQSVRSLLRKYRYNADGALIPSSVQYFIKLPQSSDADPILVPINDKAFSPMGGFVRYYKEVPPIPRMW